MELHQCPVYGHGLEPIDHHYPTADGREQVWLACSWSGLITDFAPTSDTPPAEPDAEPPTEFVTPTNPFEPAPTDAPTPDAPDQAVVPGETDATPTEPEHVSEPPTVPSEPEQESQTEAAAWPDE